MILHHEKRAHAYKVCCEKLETDDLITEYLIDFNHDLSKIEKLLRSCLHKQSLPDLTNDTLYSGDCQRAYNESDGRLQAQLNNRTVIFNQIYRMKHIYFIKGFNYD
ncbi:unnamed protein product [Rotaria sp. Silwood2]|nr:unnamed protein product [Rotaria sp. Silwood2]